MRNIAQEMMLIDAGAEIDPEKAKELLLELARLKREVEALRKDAELALGILWMIDEREGLVHDAFNVLHEALGKEGLRRGIKHAIDRGYEAQHPSGADWWAGKKEDAAIDAARKT